jgi:abequosyltransferase
MNMPPSEAASTGTWRKVVELARGEYCWLFSADDIMGDGAIARVLAARAIATTCCCACTARTRLTMELIEPSYPVLASDEPAHFQLAINAIRSWYFQLAATTEAFFSFIGGLVVRTATWRSVPLDERFVGTCWAHVARLFLIMQSRLSVRFLGQTLLPDAATTIRSRPREWCAVSPGDRRLSRPGPTFLG